VLIALIDVNNIHGNLLGLLAIWIWTFNYVKKVVMVNNSTNIKKNDQSPLNREGQQYQQNKQSPLNREGQQYQQNDQSLLTSTHYCLFRHS
jgi:hypothetical protein